MPETTPKERRHARTRQEILDAALAILHEKGPEKLSLRAIARRVDYSPAGLYEYFANKEEIISAVCAEGDRRLGLLLKAVPKDLLPDDYLVRLGLAYIRYARENTAHFMLTFMSFVTPSPSEPVPMETIDVGEPFQILLDGVQSAIEVGVIVLREGQDLMSVAYGLWSIVHGMATLQLTNLRDVALDYPRVDRAALETILRGLGEC